MHAHSTSKDQQHHHFTYKMIYQVCLLINLFRCEMISLWVAAVIEEINSYTVDNVYIFCTFVGEVWRRLHSRPIRTAGDSNYCNVLTEIMKYTKIHGQKM